MESAIKKAAKIKVNIINKDPFDCGLRKLLNFGHTFGHALEYMTNYEKLLHGEAISIGMIAACRLGYKLKLTPEALEQRIKHLLNTLKLPVVFPEIKFSLLEKTLLQDKKRQGGKIVFVIPRQIGKMAVVSGVPLDMVFQVVKELTYDS